MTAILTRVPQRRNARWCHVAEHEGSVELGLFVTSPLELEEVRIGRERHRGVPQLPGLFAARDPRDHRPEERDAVDVDGRRTDVRTDRAHPGVVALTQRGAVGLLLL